MPQRCVVYGHRLTRPKYFGNQDQFYIRHCQNCEYIATGELIITKSGISVQKNKPSYSRDTGMTNPVDSISSIDSTKSIETTRQTSIDSHNSQPQIIESTYREPNKDI